MRNYILSIVFTVMLCGLTMPCAAQSNNLTFSFINQMWSEYVLENGARPDIRPVNQTDAMITYGKFFLDLWGSTGINGKANGGREVDVNVGWNGDYFSLGASYYDLNPLLSNKNGDIVKMFVEAHRRFVLNDRHTLTPYVRFTYNLATTGTEKNSGSFTRAGLDHEWDITSRITLKEGLWFLYDSGVYGSDHGMMSRYWSEIDYKISDAVTFSPLLLAVSVPVMGIRDRHLNAAIGTGISISLD